MEYFYIDAANSVYPCSHASVTKVLGIVQLISLSFLGKTFVVQEKKMDLPPNKARVLRNYSLDKKWELVCDQEKVTDQGAPSVYLDKLRLCLDPKGNKKKKKLLGDDTSTMVLKHLETSLRTNSIDWVRDFLSDDNNGLRVLVQYLRYTQDSGGLRLPPHMLNNGPAGDHATDSSGTLKHSFYNNLQSQLQAELNNVTLKKLKLNGVKSGSGCYGQPEDDIHVCIQCLRAIMNNTYGFNMVFNDNEAIYCLVCSILHPSLRTKASVLILLAAICLVKGGHDLIINAFNRFKIEFREANRFQTLFTFFRDPDEFHVDFMVACMQFINIVVHSVEDKNYRIFLQHEFKLLGLDEYIDRLRMNESEELHTQISAYLENMYDVGQLLEDSDQKSAYQMRCEELQMELSRAMEKIQEVEANYVMQVVRLDNRLAELSKERENLMSLQQRTDNDLNTLRRVLSQKEQESQQKQFRLESRIQELEQLQKSLKTGLTTLSSNESCTSPHPPAPGPSTISAPIPPPPPLPTVIPPPPPPIFLLANQGASGSRPQFPAPNLPNAEFGAVTIKRRIPTKYKLPQLNWTALKPNQLKGTIFSELDDERVIEKIDFESFEEMFKLSSVPTGHPSVSQNVPNGSVSSCSHEPSSASSPASSSVEFSHQQTPQSAKNQILLDHKRLRNLAITRRKLATGAADVARAVNNFDLQVLEPENVEILLRVLPTPEEIKAYKDYESAQKSIQALSEEDKFLIQLSKIERLAQKLQIMSFMANFRESIDLLNPSLTTIIAASKSVKDASCFHKVLEIILAYGNYMNSGKRGGVYGFKLQSLDILPFLKSPGSKNFTLLNAVAMTVREKYPELIKFIQELKFVEKASSISLDAIMVDVAELDKLFDLTKKECALRSPDVPAHLSQFLGSVDSKLGELRSNTKVAQEAFRACVEFYGETAKSTTTSAFFTVLMNFCKHFQQADEDNQARKRAEALQQSLNSSKRSPAKKASPGNERQDLRSRQAAVIDELTEKRGSVLKRASLLQAQRSIGAMGDQSEAPSSRKRELGEMGLGTFDDIISDMTRKPYIDVAVSKRQRNSVKDFTNGDLNGRIRVSKPVETDM